MKREKLKEPYKDAEVEIILFEFSDIVTTSGGNTGSGSWGETPDSGDLGDWVRP